MSIQELIKEFNNTKFICGVEISREQQFALRYAALRLKELNENKDQQIAELQIENKELKEQYKKAIESLEKLKIFCQSNFNSWRFSQDFGALYEKYDISNAYLDVELKIDTLIADLKGNTK